MGTITGMIEPDKVALSVEITEINGTFRMPYLRALQASQPAASQPSGRWAERIANPSIERSIAGFPALLNPHLSHALRPFQSCDRSSIELDESTNS